MALAFLNGKGIIYANYIPRGNTVHANYVKKALARFLMILRKKRPSLFSWDWFPHRNNATVHTSALFQKFLEAKGVKTICHPLYSPDLATAEFFLSPLVKSELAHLPDPGQLQEELVWWLSGTSFQR
jgi:hypothetical protein